MNLTEIVEKLSEQPIKRYCRHCGMPKKIVFTGYFNEETGQKITEWACENLRCEVGCGNAGHQFKTFLGFGSCTRCGTDYRMD